MPVPVKSNRTHNRIKQIVASSGGAVITSFTMTPLDVIKIRLQSQNRVMHKGDCFIYRNGIADHLCTCLNGPDSWYNRKIPGGRYNGTIDAMIKIVRAEGLSSLWSGLPPTLFMAIPQTILYFTSYEEIKNMVGYHPITNSNPLLPVISGGIARILAVTAVSPIEMMRTKMQSEQFKYSEVIKFMRYSIQTDGVQSLYRGLISTILRDVPFSMIYWLNYESLKTFFLKRQVDKTIIYLDSMTTALCGAMAGSVAAIITNPMDVVKTYRQIQLGERDLNKKARKTLFIIKDIRRTKGISALWAGLTPRMARVAISCAIMITTFEYFKQLFNGID